MLQEGATRRKHNSGRLLWYNDVPYHPGDSYADAGVFICVSSSILFVCYNIYYCHVVVGMFDDRLIFHSPQFHNGPLSLSADRLIAFAAYSIDGSIHTSLDRIDRVYHHTTRKHPPLFLHRPPSDD